METKNLMNNISMKAYTCQLEKYLTKQVARFVALSSLPLHSCRFDSHPNLGVT